MTDDIQRVVAAGYNEAADAYLDRFGASTVRQNWFGRLVDGLPAAGGHVLDLGCGAGVPVARDLVAMGHAVVGVEGSPQQIVRARRAVPQAMFIEADMCSLSFDPGSFDAVGAFYSITHVPPQQQRGLIASIATWLKPGGTFVASFGTGAAGEWFGEWLGTRMFFGHCGEGEILKALADNGFVLRHSSTEKQDNQAAKFIWVEATKGGL